MEQLIPLVNKLHDILQRGDIQNPISLPQIAVVGSQSSGKSSVLESIVRQDFLPRGVGIVTRRPLILKLIQNRENQSVFAQFQHQNNIKIENFKIVTEEIIKETERICGTNKNISKEPIHLKITSPYVLDLTLIDLPGIVKVPSGEQPPDIESQITNLILEFIKPQNTIILAITAANTDLANSDALKLARQVDPSGDRTIGVLTKLDLMDRGTNAVDMLTSNIYSLKLGYVGVICRSQEDILKGKKLEKHLTDEAKWFQQNKDYTDMQQKMGITFLSRKLNQTLVEHIQKSLPEVKDQISMTLHETMGELQSLGERLQSQESQRTIFLDILNAFQKQYKDRLSGFHLDENMRNQLLGGAKIQELLNIYRQTVEQVSPLSGLQDCEIRSIWANCGGYKGSLFIPENAFETLAKKQIMLLQPCSQECIRNVYSELLQILASINLKNYQRFPYLKETLFEQSIKFLQECQTPAVTMVDNLFFIESNYINFWNSNLVSANEALKKAQQIVQEEYQEEEQPVAKKVVMKKTSQSHFTNQELHMPGYAEIMNLSLQMTKKERCITIAIKILLENYIKITKNNLQDIVPKIAVSFLIVQSMEKLYDNLVNKLFVPETIEKLMQESPNVQERRKNLSLMVGSLEQCLDALIEVRNIKIL